MCKRTRWTTFHKNARTFTAKPDCNSWKCPPCRDKLKDKWIAHATKILMACGLYLGFLDIDPDAYPSFARKLRRKGGLHFRVRLPNGRFGLIVGMTTYPTYWPFKADSVNRHQAVEIFTQWVEEVQGSAGGNPISSSRPWALPRRDHSDWDKVAVGPTPAQVKAAAAVVTGGTVFCRELSFGCGTVTVCDGTAAAIDELCGLVAAMSETHNTRTYEDSDTAPFSWRGFPDEAPEPYLVGAVT